MGAIWGEGRRVLNRSMIADNKTTEETPKDRPFNPFRIPKSDSANVLVCDVVNQLQNFESHRRPRKRKRRQKDQQTFERTVATVVSDLVHRYVTEPDGYLAVTLSKQILGRSGCYRSPVLNGTLPNVLKNLAKPDMAFVELEKGHQGYFNNAKQSTIKAGVRLITRINNLELSTSDFAIDPCQEVIILKKAKSDIFDNGEWMEYQDTDQIKQYREQLDRINRWIEKADIKLDPIIALENDSDVSDRLLRRYFNNGSFKMGGRLFGGFWQNLKKEERQKGITISGHSIITLDYSQMAPRILYSMVGLNTPLTDPYDLPRWRFYRNGIKKVFNALLFAEKPLQRFPKDTKKLFFPNAKIQNVVEDITKQHNSVSHLFYTRPGFKILFIESEILISVLLKLIDKGIVALPVHDAVIIPETAKDVAVQVMEETFSELTGIQGKVHMEN